MTYETEFVGEDVVHVATKDPDVLRQLEAHPAAERIEQGESAKFRMPREEFELHYPAGT